MIYRNNARSNDFVYDTNGAVAYIDVGGGEPISGVYAAPPFKTEYSLLYEGKSYHGVASDFELTDCVAADPATTIFNYDSRDGFVRVSVTQSRKQGLYTQSCRISHNTGGSLCVKQLYNYFGFVDVRLLRSGDYAAEAEIGVLHNDWGAEGQLFWHEPHELGVIRPTGHMTGYCAEITSSTCWSTKRYMPVVFIRDKVTGRVYFCQHLPTGPYSFELGLVDTERVEGSCFSIAAGSGTSERHGWRLYLGEGEHYDCCVSAYGAAKDLDEALVFLTRWRRAEVAPADRAPLMFNDYMNCLWTRQNERDCIALIDLAKKLGCEGYCFDDGWFRDEGQGNELGNWYPATKRFAPRTFAEMVAYIRERGLIAGLWTELEVCSLSNRASELPDECFLCNEGRRIYRSGRQYFNLSNARAREYLISRITDLYRMGIRYIKNDYNGHPGAGVDWPGASPAAGLELHMRAVNDFYRELKDIFPDLYIESCASGAMRGDGETNRNFCLQSVSDCEEYYKLPSILSGTMLSLLPEQIGVWAYPYPRVFWEMNGDDYLTPEYIESMRDGEQTVFNMVCGAMGTLYLSGKLDRADETNLGLVEQGVRAYKSMRNFICEAVPFFPLPHTHIFDKSYACIGLRRGDEAYLAVFRTGDASDSVFVPIEGVESVREIYPCRNYKLDASESGIRITFTKPVAAVLIKVATKGAKI